MFLHLIRHVPNNILHTTKRWNYFLGLDTNKNIYKNNFTCISFQNFTIFGTNKEFYVKFQNRNTAYCINLI